MSNPKSYMTNLPDSMLLSDVCMPGTHDSLAYNASARVVIEWARCQNKNIKEQLDMGVRFLDIRLDKNWGGKHGDIALPHNMSHVIKYCREFFKESPKETIIMRLKHDSEKGKFKDFEDGYTKHIDKNKDMFWKRGDDLKIPALGQCRGKIVVLDQLNKCGSISHMVYNKGFGFLWNNHDIFAIQDEYNNPGFTAKSELVKAHMEANQGTTGKFVINFVSAALDGVKSIDRTPGKYNSEVTPKVLKWFAEKSTWRNHILVWDFIEPEKAKLSFIRNSNK